MIVLMKSDGEGLKKKAAKQNTSFVNNCYIVSNTRNNITWMPVEKIQRFVIWPLPTSRNVQLI